MGRKHFMTAAAVFLALAAAMTSLSLAWFYSEDTGSRGKIEAAQFHVSVSVDGAESSSAFTAVLTPTVAGDDARFNEVAQVIPVSVTNSGAVAVRVTFSVEAAAVLHYAVIDKTGEIDAAAELAAAAVTEENWQAFAAEGLAAVNGSVLAPGAARSFSAIYWLCYDCAGYGGGLKPPADGAQASIVLRAGATQAEGGNGPA